MKRRLLELDADAVRVLARNKDRTHRYRATPDGLAGGSGSAEGYVIAGDVSALVDAFGPVEDRNGNAIIHEVDLDEPFVDGRAPMAAIAVDLWIHWRPANAAPDNASSTNCSMSEPEQSNLMLWLVLVCAGGSGVTTWQPTATL